MKTTSHSTQPPEDNQQSIDAPITSITTHHLDNGPSPEMNPVLHQNIPTNLIPVESQQNNKDNLTPSCLEAVSSTLPKKITMSRDALHRAVGYYNVNNLIKHLHEIGQKTVQVQNIPKIDLIDTGEVASMPSQKRQTTPSTPPPSYSDIWHMDIGHGPCTAIGGARYTLLLVDKCTQFKFVFGLKNLTTSLLDAIKRFRRSCGIKPKLIRTDFDNKLISGEVEKYLLDEKIKIEASPPYRQHQNGLVERHWQSILAMSQNWLRSAMLPTKYWYFAVKRAVEVLNMMPIKNKKNNYAI